MNPTEKLGRPYKAMAYHQRTQAGLARLKLAQAKREKRLPAVLSREEVGRIMSQIGTFHNYVYLKTVYTCGLRLQEGLFLEVSDIDAARRMIHIHRGKGARDRYVPLPESTLELLRRYWLTHRNDKLIFPAVGRSRQKAPVSEHPMSIDGVQGAFRQAKFKATMAKQGLLPFIDPQAWQVTWNVIARPWATLRPR